MSIKVSEIFMSLQGEGKFVGTPSLFLRTFGCNFSCSGFGMPRGEKSTERFQIDPTKYTEFKQLPLVKTGCDSYSSWMPEFKHLSPLMEIDNIVDEMEHLLPNRHFGKDKHLILTGGEPLLGWQKQYPALLTEIYGRELGLTDLTFETNGTQFIGPELRRGLCDNFNYHKLATTFSVSAKLPCSGEKWQDAIKPEIVMDYTTIPGSNVYLKFVVATEEDVKDANNAVAEYQDAGFAGSIYLMPVGGTDESYYLNNKTVAELALKNGYRYSPQDYNVICGQITGIHNVGVIMIVDFEKWKSLEDSKDDVYSTPQVDILSAVHVLMPYTIGFMLNPITEYKGKVLESMTHKISDIEEFKKSLGNDKIFLYRLYRVFDGNWIIRYSKLV